MSRSGAEELESLREETRSVERRRALRESARATARWDRRHPTDLVGVLAWIEELRALFGDPPVDRRPWRGEDFRL